jgi:hypothetical protein
MRILYLATPLQTFKDLLEVQIGLALAFLERLQVLRLIGKTELHSFVDELRNRTVRLGSSEPQGAVQVSIEVDSSSFLRALHIPNIAP